MSRHPDDAAPVIASPWTALRQHTRARIALGRAGHSLPTREHLAFQLAHAQARDAVHLALDSGALLTALHDAGLAALPVHSAAIDRAAYLQRPDLGRRLDPDSLARLQALQPVADTPVAGDGLPLELSFAVVDGLSALAVHRHAVALIEATCALLGAPGQPAWHLTPVAVAAQGRVALGDEIGAALGAQAVVVLIGERPGLSSPDSLGVYITWAPRPGRSDAERNCISNIRPEGMDLPLAAVKIVQLLGQARLAGFTGVALKDDRDDGPGLTGPGVTEAPAHFLLAGLSAGPRS